MDIPSPPQPSARELHPLEVKVLLHASRRGALEPGPPGGRPRLQHRPGQPGAELARRKGLRGGDRARARGCSTRSRISAGNAWRRAPTSSGSCDLACLGRPAVPSGDRAASSASRQRTSARRSAALQGQGPRHGRGEAGGARGRRRGKSLLRGRRPVQALLAGRRAPLDEAVLCPARTASLPPPRQRSAAPREASSGSWSARR